MHDHDLAFEDRGGLTAVVVTPVVLNLIDFRTIVVLTRDILPAGYFTPPRHENRVTDSPPQIVLERPWKFRASCRVTAQNLHS